MVVSSGSKRGQTTVAVIFSSIYLMLILAFIQSGNYNYLWLILFSFITFLPAFFFMFRFYDIAIEGKIFVIKNLLVKKTIDASLFSGVSPAKYILPLPNSPYFSIHFDNKKKFDFKKNRRLREIFKSQSSISEELTKEILTYINAAKE